LSGTIGVCSGFIEAVFTSQQPGIAQVFKSF
jgi:hypothetical protein